MKHRVDYNQKDIVNYFRKVGAKVAVTSRLGNGFPDLVVAYRGKLFMVEVKDGAKPPSQRALTPSEQGFHDAWVPHVHVVTSIDDAEKIVKGLSPQPCGFCYE